MAFLNFNGLKQYNKKIKEYIENKIKDIEVEKLATKDELKNHADDSNIHVTNAEKNTWNAKLDNTDLTGYAKTVDVNYALSKKVDKVTGKSLISDTEIARLATINNYDDTNIKNTLNKKADKTEIPDISNLATKNELKNHTDNTTIHVTSTEKNTWNNKLDNSALTNYATKTYVTDEIVKASTSGKVDLTGYAKTADLNAHTSDTSIHITSAEKSKLNEVDKKLSIKQSTSDNGKILKVGNDGNIKFVEDLADNVSYQNSNYPSWTNVKKALDGIMAKVDYIKPEITSFTSTAQEVYEVGQNVSNIVFNWTTNKNITTQTLTDCPLADANVRTATYTNNITSNKTFTLTIGDGQNTASKNISISFRNKIYYGSSVIPTNFNSAFILGLSNKKFATGKSGSFDITVGSNEYGFIAFPSSFGTLSSVKIGGFDTDVISCGTISFTNASGGTTNYNIYRTGRHSLGAITMVIS